MKLFKRNLFVKFQFIMSSLEEFTDHNRICDSNLQSIHGFGPNCLKLYRHKMRHTSDSMSDVLLSLYLLYENLAMYLQCNGF